MPDTHGYVTYSTYLITLSEASHSRALAANPQIQTDAEVSTNYGTAGQMAAAARSVNADGSPWRPRNGARPA